MWRLSNNQGLGFIALVVLMVVTAIAVAGVAG